MTGSGARLREAWQEAAAEAPAWGGVDTAVAIRAGRRRRAARRLARTAGSLAAVVLLAGAGGLLVTRAIAPHGTSPAAGGRRLAYLEWVRVESDGMTATPAILSPSRTWAFTNGDC